jgi:hypothetical protein
MTPAVCKLSVPPVSASIEAAIGKNVLLPQDDERASICVLQKLIEMFTENRKKQNQSFLFEIPVATTIAGGCRF